MPPQLHFSLGPACRAPEVLTQILAVTPWCRINLSHQDRAALPKIFARLHASAVQQKRPVFVAPDLRGRKLRTGPIDVDSEAKSRHADSGVAPSILLQTGQEIFLRGCAVDEERAFVDNTLTINHPGLCDLLQTGDAILLDDGALQLSVVKAQGERLHCRVQRGGPLYARVGCNLPARPLQLPALSSRDLADLDLFAALPKAQQPQAFYLSYVETGDDITLLRSALRQRHLEAQIIAKVETRAALDKLDAISEACDILCLARGDLGVALPLAQLPAAQAQFAKVAAQHHRPWLLAGEVALSLLHRQQISRAELSALHLACQQGAAGLVLSDESALGFSPARSIVELAALVQNLCPQTALLA